MSFSVFRRVVEKGIFRKLGGGGRMMSSIRSDVWRPLLMVPHLFDDSGSVVSKFHSVGIGIGIGREEDQVSYANRISGGIDGTKRKGAVQVVGMSHGWLALYNQISHGMHMVNPINGHRIELPSLPSGSGGVSRVVLSHSPDQSSTCRAVVIYDGGSKLAYCVPGSSKEWTPMVDDDDDRDHDHEREYEDVLYEDKDEIRAYDRCEFHCLTSNPLEELELETWDVTDPLSPIVMAYTYRASSSPRPCRSRQDWELKKKCWRINYLMHGSSGGYLYLVVRYVLPMHNSNPNQSSTSRQCHPYQTIGFDVYRITVGSEVKYDSYEDVIDSNFRYMKASLDDVAIFIGTNCSTSVIARECPEVRPNCIYYTDDIRLRQKSTSFQCGGHDNGIFDYQNSTFSTCSCGTSNCPLDNPNSEMLDPAAPIWFHFSLPSV